MEAVINSRVSALTNAYNQGQTSRQDAESVQNRADKLKEISGLQDDVKLETENIKNVNDLFGALKKSEKTIIKIEKAVANGDIEGAKELLNTTYKEEKVLYAIPLKNGSLDGGALIDKSLESDNLASVTKELKEAIAKDLEEVKKEMLGKTSAMGVEAQKSINNSGVNLDLSSISKSSNMDYLKEQMKSLLE